MRASEFPRVGMTALLAAIAVTGYAQRDDLGYDPAADPFALLEDARASAAAEDKLVLVIAGGEWCIWCHYLDAFLTEHAKIGKALKDTFVVVKAYIGDEKNNDAFFATLPDAAGYPHFWVVAPDGAVLASQNTLPLEDGEKSYDAGRFMAFIDEWRRAPRVEGGVPR